MIDFDLILTKIGGLGRFQIFLVCVTVYSSIPAGYNSLAPVFMNYTPDYRCKVQQNCTEGLNESEIINLTTPTKEDGSYDFCKRYPYTNKSSCSSDECGCFDKEAEPIGCDEGYFYNTDLFTETVITEFDLVCDQAYLDSLATVLYMVGVLFGAPIFGNVSDRFGRKSTMVVSAVCTFLALFGCCFTHNLWLFVTCRFSVAFFGAGIYLANFVYLVEITSSEWRTMLGVSFQMGFAIGYMVLSGFAYQWHDWHEMQFVMAMFTLPYALALFLVPESPRWLFSNGRNEEAKKITRRFAKINKVELDEKTIWDEAEKSGLLKEIEESKKDTRTYTTLDLFRTPRTRTVTFLVIFAWLVNGLVYYGISLNVGSLAGDIFVNNVLGGVMEIGAYIFVILLMDRIGRRMILVIMMGLAGVTLICATIVNLYADGDSGLLTLGTVFSLAGKVGISGSYAVIYNFTIELFPTVVRMNGIAVASLGARVGSILAPLLIALEDYIPWLPNVIFGVASLLAGGLSLYLPETNGIDMLESIEDAELFYKNRKTPPSKTSEAYENPVFHTKL